MANKPEIQYIGQFYVHGSEAKELARKKEQKKAKTQLPSQSVVRVRRVYVDPLAIACLVVSAVMLVTMVMGALSLQTAWHELDVARQYVYEQEALHRSLVESYYACYDLNETRSAALALGMIPVEEAQVTSLHVTVPVQEPELSWTEELVWFLEGLFA